MHKRSSTSSILIGIFLSTIIMILAARKGHLVVADTKEDESCIQVTVPQPDHLTAFLPVIRGGSSGALATNDSTIRSVTEDTDGCLKFVGDVIHFTLDAGETGGTATVDIGEVNLGVSLFDDGTNGDTTPNDGVYERAYEVTASDVVRWADVTGRFTNADGQVARPVHSPGLITITNWATGESSSDPYANYTPDPEGILHDSDRMIISFREGTSLESVRNTLAAYDLILAGWLPELLVFEVELHQGQDYELIRRQLIDLAIVEHVERNYAMQLLGAPQTFADGRMPVEQANYLNPIRAKLGWEITEGNPDVKVAVIDTGVNATHPDLSGQVEAAYKCLGCSSEGDQDGHGTFVAGLIAAEKGTTGISGIAPDSRLIVYKVPKLTDRAESNPFSIAVDLYYAAKDGARVVNISSGGPDAWPYTYRNPYIFFKRPLNYALDQNVVIVAAVNEEKEGKPRQEFFKEEEEGNHKWYPASFKGVLAVGASNLNDTVANYSDYGNQVVYAPTPATGIVSTHRTGSYAVGTGTSYAAPQVAALAALIISIHPDPNVSNKDVIDIIQQTADEMPGEKGFGRINVYRALSAAKAGTLDEDPGPDPLPEAVTKLNAVASDAGSVITLTWAAPTSDYAGVHIYRQEEGRTDIQQLEGSLITGTSYEDHNVDGGASYSYHVFAVDTTGQESVRPARAIEFVSQTGGATNAVAVHGNYAFIGLGPRLGVLDVSSPTEPKLISESALLPNLVVDLVVAGDYVYALTTKGLAVLDVGDPRAPVVLDDSLTFSVYGAVGKSGGIQVEGDYVYITTNGTSASCCLRIVDVSTPAEPVPVTVVRVEAEELAVANGYAYVTSNMGDFQIIDVRNPDNPAVVYSHSVEHPSSVAVDGNYAYLRTTDGVQIYNISSPYAAAPVGLIDDDRTGGALAASAGRLYFTGTGGLRIFDVANPNQPVQLGLLETATYSVNILADDHIYIAGLEQLTLVNASNPADPVALSSFAPITPEDVAVAGDYAYLADEYGLRILDWSMPGTPIAIGNYETRGFLHGITLYGNYAWLTYGNPVIDIIDISEPVTPRHVGGARTRGIVNRVQMLGSHAYVADGPGGLLIFDLADPSHPVEVGHYNTKSDAKDIAVADGNAYVVTQDGLSIIDISVPASPVELDFVNFEAGILISAIEAAKNFVFLIDTYSVLHIINVEDPTNSSRVARYDVIASSLSRGHAMARERNLLFIAFSGIYGSGIVVVDISMPTHPTQYARIDSPVRYYVDEVAVQDGYVYLVSGDTGLWIYSNLVGTR